MKRNHFTIEVCTCGYSTYSKKWMQKHLRNKHNENGVFSFSQEIKGNEKLEA